MSKVKKLYTTPIICKGANNDWFVFFRYWDANAGRYKPFKFREELNRIRDLKEKEAEFKALREARETWLKIGWNPITNTFPQNKSSDDLNLDKLKEMNLSQALNFAAKKKRPDWSYKTAQDYTSKIKYVVEASTRLNLQSLPVKEYKRLHYSALLEDIKEVRKLSAAGFNIYRDYLSSLLGKLEELEILEYNPIAKIKTKETIKKVCHRPPTQDERTAIVNRVSQSYRNYYRYLSVLYGTTIRPKEITGLKIKHLHKVEQIFRLTPDSYSSTKTKVQRDVPIPDWVMSVLSEIKLHKYEQEWYIFSCSGPGESFTPGPKRMHSNTTTRWWYEIVKAPVKEGGLGLDVNQYALKKMAGDDMIKLQRREGVDKLLELPKMMMGHTDTEMTEVYVTEHKEVIKELIKRKMPVL